MLGGLGAESDLFDFDLFLCTAGLAFAFGPLVQEFAEVHDLADRGIGIGRYLD